MVHLPDGRAVRGRGLRHGAPVGEPPDFGVYLLGRRPLPMAWPTRWIPWPEFRCPTDRDQALRVLAVAYDRAEHERVELACRGGVGRTGTALAVLAVLGGVSPQSAVEWVRERYHPRAVETLWQRRWVSSLTP